METVGELINRRAEWEKENEEGEEGEIYEGTQLSLQSLNVTSVNKMSRAVVLRLSHYMPSEAERLATKISSSRLGIFELCIHSGDRVL
jgi:hypothetical protein